MPPDLEKMAEVRAWLSRASEDLRAADVEEKAIPPLTAHMVFHAQQAAEKAMKAFLVDHNRVFRKTHSLVELGEPCVAIDPSLRDLVLRAVPLTEYAWRFRYPGDEFAPSLETAAHAVALAREVLQAVRTRASAETRP